MQTKERPRRGHNASAAGAKAIAIRDARAAAKRYVADGGRYASRKRAAEIIANPDQLLRTMPVLQLMTACWWVGPDGAARTLRRLHVRETRLGMLTENERGKLVLSLLGNG